MSDTTATSGSWNGLGVGMGNRWHLTDPTPIAPFPDLAGRHELEVM